jgi:hypothetical protein
MSTFATLITSVRAQAHLAGNVPYSDSDILQTLIQSAGDIFLGVPYLQERFWSETYVPTALSSGLSIPMPQGMYRMISIEGVDTDGNSVFIDKEAKWSEVVSERAVDLTDEDEAPYERAKIYAYRDGKIELSIELDPTGDNDITLTYVKDPLYGVDEVTDTVDFPASLIGAIVQKAVAKCENHTNGERGQVLLQDVGYTLQRMKAGIEINESKDRKRVGNEYNGSRKSSSSGFIRMNDA